jgi:glutathionylspermidine synthase
MRCIASTPRPHWREQCEQLGFTFHSIDGLYWDESKAYQFTHAQIEHLEAVTEELHQRCLEAIAWVIRENHFAPFNLPPQAIALIKRSWARQEPSLYGRFDFSWDGQGEPKMLEYNADTPTGLLEASVVQWHWLQECQPQADQFNSLHEKLIARWQAIAPCGRQYFAAIDEHEEDTANLLYLLDTAQQAGLATHYLTIEQIGFSQLQRRFVDELNRPIEHCFKLYPWEWLIDDEFGQYLLESETRFLEPAWKLLLSSKAILPILWQLFPNHPNLLAASFTADLDGPSVRKPLYSREGSNIQIVADQLLVESDGPYTEGPCIYQAFAPLPRFADSYAVIGSWIIGDAAAGIGIREDASLITRDSSRFVPHFFIDESHREI